MIMVAYSSNGDFKFFPVVDDDDDDRCPLVEFDNFKCVRTTCSCLHLNGLDFECVFSCDFNFATETKCLPHSRQANRSNPGVWPVTMLFIQVVPPVPPILPIVPIFVPVIVVGHCPCIGCCPVVVAVVAITDNDDVVDTDTVPVIVVPVGNIPIPLTVTVPPLTIETLKDLSR
ncbi:hypothetical protein DERP_012778 [Dermatophagoides pteronyssinus]|uniref:Uncharacterized protein n=1 Tax=Dermatophagoides pteronyssinus TaxID=6956 RepID=A0ABQ8JQA7_DERPT|nr:hypothetical protein DERP_012778 [Dermatophagoides pteronyssinus]